MHPPRFVHLRLHSEYSIVDGTLRIDAAVDAAAGDGMPALALTDLANMFGLVKFYRGARRAGVKPIIGCDAWLTHESSRDQPYRILLLATSHGGYLKLCTWLTRAYRGNQHRGRAELRREWFDEGTDGLIALSGWRDGDVGLALVNGNAGAAIAAARAAAARFPGRYYLEVQRAGHPDDDMLVDATLRIASEAALPVVATHPVQFLRRDDYRAHEARVCIAEGQSLADTRRPRRFTPEQYFTSQDEMAAKFSDLPQALANSVAIAQRCNTTIEIGVNHLPAFPTPEGVGLDQHLRQKSEAGLETRLAKLYDDPALRDRRRPDYAARLAFEIGTIVQMGFAGYFLIVADFIEWARHNGVPVGPGRGSGAGSLVAYALGITDLDPLRYNLLFERFLNPERVSMPDFDIDFCQDTRERVIDYVKSKYGADSVSQIATFGTLAARAAVRDVGRVLDLPYGLVDGIAKLIPFQPGRTVTLRKAPAREAEREANVIYARDQEPQLEARERAEDEVREVLSLAEELEGLPRNVGMHAGGVLIVPGKLTDFCPLYVQPGADALVSQFDKDDVEAAGLVKFDFLGLTTLTILDWTLRYVRKLYPGNTLALDTLPLDDKPSYDIFRTANTSAVFQFESRGMRDLLLRAPPTRFEDIVALVALYRPGPMELIPAYVEARMGRRRVAYADARLAPILEQTYGVMVYQEQVMQIAQVIGGYTLGAADLLRRAMGKKKKEEMATHRDIFVAGAKANGVAPATATELFDNMEKFAGYGFNKSHAAAYALVAYQTAYFKAHHPAAFMAANLSLVMDHTDKVRALYADTLDQGLEVLPPDINQSAYRFEPVDPARIRYGLGGIKGTGASAIEAVVAARAAGGDFTGLSDFCRRVDKRAVNRRAVEALIRGGAFDAIDARRATLLAGLGAVLSDAERATAQAAQDTLFGADAGASAPPLPAVADWTEAERLAQEKSALGFYISGHPFNAHAAELAGLVRTRLADIEPRGERYLIAGVVTAVRTQVSRRGKMAFITLDDGKGSIEIVVFNETFEAARARLREDALVIAEVKVSQRVSEEGEQQGLRVIVENVFDLAEARRRFARKLLIMCNGNADGDRLEAILAPHRKGTTPISVHFENNGVGGDFDLPEAWNVALDDVLIERLNDWLTPSAVTIVY